MIIISHSSVSLRDWDVPRTSHLSVGHFFSIAVRKTGLTFAGLHQMIVVPSSDSTALKSAVDAAFVSILRGRQWHPLVARLCDAQNLRGLPMLRQLAPYLIGSDYNYDFLQQNCAVNDDSGKILDLYVAMADDTVSWVELKDVAVHTSGLSCLGV